MRQSSSTAEPVEWPSISSAASMPRTRSQSGGQTSLDQRQQQQKQQHDQQQQQHEDSSENDDESGNGGGSSSASAKPSRESIIRDLEQEKIPGCVMELFGVGSVSLDLVQSIVKAALNAADEDSASECPIENIATAIPENTSTSEDTGDDNSGENQSEQTIRITFKSQSDRDSAIIAMRLYGQIPYARPFGSALAPKAHPRLAAIDCVIWATTGACDNDENCPFRHPPPVARVPCRHWLRNHGECWYAEHCNFLHPGTAIWNSSKSSAQQEEGEGADEASTKNNQKGSSSPSQRSPKSKRTASINSDPSSIGFNTSGNASSKKSSAKTTAAASPGSPAPKTKSPQKSNNNNSHANNANNNNSSPSSSTPGSTASSPTRPPPGLPASMVRQPSTSGGEGLRSSTISNSSSGSKPHAVVSPLRDRAISLSSVGSTGVTSEEPRLSGSLIPAAASASPGPTRATRSNTIHTVPIGQQWPSSISVSSTTTSNNNPWSQIANRGRTYSVGANPIGGSSTDIFGRPISQPPQQQPDPHESLLSTSFSSIEDEVVSPRFGGLGPTVVEIRECMLCRSRPSAVALVPCGHHVLCEGCALTFGAGRLCPLCGRQTSHVLRIYL